MEQWRTRYVTSETKSEFLAAAARFLNQISQFLYQVPVSVASREITRGTWNVWSCVCACGC